ncbi:MAG: DUF4861 family protein [Bacteroidota bacterium]|nr:DUF4861 family protein [Bacteroidota bacterium]MDP4190532.1 DUF4861 family protein [Bacteroidota bacterium]MDP4193665.1 DUF4861 family protein [Bacteroidota bacterium]
MKRPYPSYFLQELLRSILLIIVIFTFLSQPALCRTNAKCQSDSAGWNKLPEILNNIKAPVFQDRKYDITSFGAKPKIEYDSRAAINKAIRKCSEQGGGIVFVPKGHYFVKGPILLKSNVNLYTEDGSILYFSTNPDDYLPVVFTRWEGIECYNYSSLIYAKDEMNMAITGKGTFNGQASNENWWKWNGKTEFGWEKGMPSQRDENGRPRLVKMNSGQIPVEKRVFGPGGYLRPNFFQIINCKNVLIDGVTFISSPMWVLHPLLSENITIQNVSITGNGPNTDGCDPESCKDVLIKNCFFKNGDDCIAIKSGRNNDGRRIAKASENIIIQDCKMNDGHGGITIGSEISGGCRNVFAENCQMDSPNLDRAIRVKSNSFRGGMIDNIFVRNIKVGQLRDAVIRFELNYEPQEGSNGGYLPQLKNVNIENIESKKSDRAFFMEGLDNAKIRDIIISNCKFDGVNTRSVIINVENLKLKDVYVNGQKLNKSERRGRITKLMVSNPLLIDRKDEIISLEIEKLKALNPEFNEVAFVVFDDKLQLPSQTDDVNGDGKADNILVLLDIKAGETKTLTIESDKIAVLKSEYKKRTHAEVSAKIDYKSENGIYIGGRFVSQDSVKIPKDHFAHDALYKYEGPGWESDKVAYRFYLDSRNRNDIFGKKTDKMVLHEVGKDDLVSDSKESYTKMCNWGMDIFKVGESLGIGSIGMISDGKVFPVSKTDNISCHIPTDGPIKSSVFTKYSNWLVDSSKKFDLASLLSIQAGSRLTRTDIKISGNPDNICTGFAKHSGCAFIKDTTNYPYGYIASYGKQSLNDDSLGLVIFYRKEDLIKLTEDESSFIVSLKPQSGKLYYYFGAAWDKELNGIRSKIEFLKYLEEESLKLSNPLLVEAEEIF